MVMVADGCLAVMAQYCSVTDVMTDRHNCYNNNTIRYDTIEEINVDSKAEYTA